MSRGCCLIVEPYLCWGGRRQVRKIVAAFGWSTVSLEGCCRAKVIAVLGRSSLNSAVNGFTQEKNFSDGVLRVLQMVLRE